MKKGWVDNRLDDLVESNVIGITKSSREQGEHKAWPYVKMNNITRDNRFDFSNITSVDATDEEVRKFALKDGDFLFNTRNSVELVGKSCVYEAASDDVVLFNNNIMRIRFKNGVDAKFILYAFSFKDVAEKLNELKSGTTNVAAIYYKDLRELRILIPPFPEQQRIVGILDEAFDGLATATANAERNLRNAHALFESHLQSVFTQRGEGWVETTLSEATGGVLTGPFGSLLHKSDYVEDGIPLVNPAHITETGIEPDPRKTVSKTTARQLSNYIMRAGDIVIGRRGEMGRCALVTDAEDGWLCGTGSFFIKPSSRCDPRYLVRFLRSNGCRQRLEKLAGGAVMPNLSNADLGKLSIALPSIDRQKTVVEAIDALAAETQRLEAIYQQKLAALGELKKSLLHRAFNGELTGDNGQLTKDNPRNGELIRDNGQ